MKLINNSSSPVFLEKGRQVGAAYTQEATIDIEESELTPEDRKRLIDRDDPILTIVEESKVEAKKEEPGSPETLSQGAPKRSPRS